MKHRARSSIAFVRWPWAVLLLLLLLSSGWAQDAIDVQVEPTGIGVAGHVRPGSWTPLQVVLANKSPNRERSLTVEWALPDADGDIVRSQRRIVLTRNSQARVWLYACPTLHTNLEKVDWKLRVYDSDTGSLIWQQPIAPRTRALLDDGANLTPYDGIIAVTGAAQLGFEPYRENLFQHERINIIYGYEPAQLPDRWQGLASLDALVWTAAVDGPDANAITQPSLRALREWVQRGGHLVVSLPAVGDTWYTSRLADMLPPVEMVTYTDVRPPSFLGFARGGNVSLTVKALYPKPGSNVTVLHHDLQNGQDLPLVVSHSYGLGRVTVVGVDLTDRQLIREGLPSGPTLWRKVFGWRNPAFTRLRVDQYRDGNNKKITEVYQRDLRTIGAFVSSSIAMSGAAAGALFVAIIAFGIYWLAAGPVGFLILKQQKRQRYAWAVFAITVGIFSVIAWSGALVARPTRTRIEHFTLLSADAASGIVRVHSWFSLFAASYADLPVELTGADDAGFTQLLSSPGTRPEAIEAGFLDPRRYALEAANPSKLAVPMRSTAKQFEADFASSSGSSVALGDAWVMPQGEVRMLPNEWFDGVLVHGLPGELRDVMFVYCRGPELEPMVWTVRAWKPGERLKLPDSPSRDTLQFLTNRPAPAGKLRDVYAGFLATLSGETSGTSEDKDAKAKEAFVSTDRIVRESQLLSFFGTLPPPDFEFDEKITANSGRQFRRLLGRCFDLSSHVSSRRLIMVGHLEGDASPVPVRVNSYAVPQRGWTVVQWMMPLPEPMVLLPPAQPTAAGLVTPPATPAQPSQGAPSPVQRVTTPDRPAE